MAVRCSPMRLPNHRDYAVIAADDAILAMRQRELSSSKDMAPSRRRKDGGPVRLFAVQRTTSQEVGVVIAVLTTQWIPYDACRVTSNMKDRPGHRPRCSQFLLR